MGGWGGGGFEDRLAKTKWFKPVETRSGDD